MRRPSLPTLCCVAAWAIACVASVSVNGQETPLSTDALLGTYERQPVENDWHVGAITRSSKEGMLQWTNRAGVSWSLRPDLPAFKLRTGSDNPYPATPDFTLQVVRGEVRGFEFKGESYSRKRTVIIPQNPPLRPEDIPHANLVGWWKMGSRDRFAILTAPDGTLMFGRGVNWSPLNKESSARYSFTESGSRKTIEANRDGSLTFQVEGNSIKYPLTRVAGVPTWEPDGWWRFDNSAISFHHLGVNETSQPLTIEFWFDTRQDNAPLFFQYNDTEAHLDSRSSLVLNVHGQGPGPFFDPQTDERASPRFQKGVPNHIAIVSDGMVVSHYLNGELVAVTDGRHAPLALNRNTPLHIGIDQGHKLFRGRIKDFRVWNTDLPAAEIAKIAQNQRSVAQTVPYQQRYLALIDWQYHFNPLGVWEREGDPRHSMTIIRRNDRIELTQYRDGKVISQDKLSPSGLNKFRKNGQGVMIEIRETIQFSPGITFRRKRLTEKELVYIRVPTGGDGPSSSGESVLVLSAGDPVKEPFDVPDRQPPSNNQDRELVALDFSGVDTQKFELEPHPKRTGLVKIKNVATGQYLSVTPEVATQQEGVRQVVVRREQGPLLRSRFVDNDDSWFRLIDTHDGRVLIAPWSSATQQRSLPFSGTQTTKNFGRAVFKVGHKYSRPVGDVLALKTLESRARVVSEYRGGAESHQAFELIPTVPSAFPNRPIGATELRYRWEELTGRKQFFERNYQTKIASVGGNDIPINPPDATKTYDGTPLVLPSPPDLTPGRVRTEIFRRFNAFYYNNPQMLNISGRGRQRVTFEADFLLSRQEQLPIEVEDLFDKFREHASADGFEEVDLDAVESFCDAILDDRRAAMGLIDDLDKIALIQKIEAGHAIEQVERVLLSSDLDRSFIADNPLQTGNRAEETLYIYESAFGATSIPATLAGSIPVVGDFVSMPYDVASGAFDPYHQIVDWSEVMNPPPVAAGGNEIPFWKAVNDQYFDKQTRFLNSSLRQHIVFDLGLIQDYAEGLSLAHASGPNSWKGLIDPDHASNKSIRDAEGLIKRLRRAAKSRAYRQLLPLRARIVGVYLTHYTPRRPEVFTPSGDVDFGRLRWQHDFGSADNQRFMPHRNGTTGQNGPLSPKARVTFSRCGNGATDSKLDHLFAWYLVGGPGNAAFKAFSEEALEDIRSHVNLVDCMDGRWMIEGRFYYDNPNATGAAQTWRESQGHKAVLEESPNPADYSLQDRGYFVPFTPPNWPSVSAHAKFQEARGRPQLMPQWTFTGDGIHAPKGKTIVIPKMEILY